MAEETILKANTGIGTVTTGNEFLNGTGSLVSIVTAGNQGTYIKNVCIKALSDTSQGMIRFFIDNGTDIRLIAEVRVESVTRSTTDKSFEKRIFLNYNLRNGYVLKASTQKNETFNIIAEAHNWSYNNLAVRSDTTKYTSVTSLGSVSTANSNLDGTGTISDILSAGDAGAGWRGCLINKIAIKALQSSTKGMIRVFIKTDRGATYLFKEVPVSVITSTGISSSFSQYVAFNNGFRLSAGYKLSFSTEIAERFAITIDAMDWTYAS